MAKWTPDDIAAMSEPALRSLVAQAPDMAAHPSIARRLGKPQLTVVPEPTPSTTKRSRQRKQAPTVDDSMLEADWQNEVIEYARSKGWKVMAILGSRHHAKVTHVGYPDLTMWRGPRLIFAELKKHDGDPSFEQSETLLELKETCDHRPECYLWRPEHREKMRAVLL